MQKDLLGKKMEKLFRTLLAFFIILRYIFEAYLGPSRTVSYRL